MKHVFRFVGTQKAEGRWALAPDEAYHALKVLRLKSGDACEITDGQGDWARGVIRHLTEKGGEVETSEAFSEPEVSHKLTVALGSLKPSTLDDLLPSLVELGTDAIHVVMQDQTAKGRLKDSVRERWERILQAACKQSKRAYFPALETFLSWDDWLGAVARDEVVVLDPAASESCLEHRWTTGNRVLLCGGEKGFSAEEERMLAREAFPRLRLGGAIMRAETAALAAVAIFNARRDTL